MKASDQISGKLSSVIEDQRGLLAPEAFAFLQRMFSGDPDKYKERLRQYGFVGLKSVLDAGCGFGQWSLAMTSLNGYVSSLELVDDRVKFLQSVINRCGVKNLSARQGSLENLPYPDQSFDGVFCYGAIMFTHWEQSLQEFHRVLRPGGRLYLNANDFGWYKYLWYTEHNKGEGYDPREHVAKALLATSRYQRGLEIGYQIDKLITLDEMLASLSSLAYELIDVAEEGCAGLQPGTDSIIPPFLPGKYAGDRGVYELLAARLN